MHPFHDPPSDLDLVWVEHDDALEPERVALLSADERARLASFGAPARCRSFVLGRTAARTLLARRLGVHAADVPIGVSDSGAPFVAAPGLFVSISHAADVAVAAAAERPLGVDVEIVVPRHPELSRFFLHPDERSVYEALPLDDLRRPILYWTLKESVLKALRTGFRLSPKKLFVEPDVPAGRARVTAEGRGVWDVRFVERAGCFVAVALEE